MASNIRKRIGTQRGLDMPAETHSLGCGIEVDDVLTLLEALLDDPSAKTIGDSTLESLGVATAELYDLWDAVREEFGERTLGPEIDLGELDPSMTLEAAAAAMVRLLPADNHGT
jgi:hypothetical protein